MGYGSSYNYEVNTFLGVRVTQEETGTSVWIGKIIEILKNHCGIVAPLITMKVLRRDGEDDVGERKMRLRKLSWMMFIKNLKVPMWPWSADAAGIRP